jgi:hypothetical protein
MAEFVGRHRSQQARQRDAELNVCLFYPIKENIAVLASSTLSQKGHTENQVGRSFPGGRDLQHKVTVARNPTTDLGDETPREQSTQTISIPASRKIRAASASASFTTARDIPALIFTRTVISAPCLSVAAAIFPHNKAASSPTQHLLPNPIALPSIPIARWSRYLHASRLHRCPPDEMWVTS